MQNCIDNLETIDAVNSGVSLKKQQTFVQHMHY